MPVHIYRGMKHFQLTGVRPVVCVAHSHEIAARKAVVLNLDNSNTAIFDVQRSLVDVTRRSCCGPWKFNTKAVHQAVLPLSLFTYNLPNFHQTSVLIDKLQFASTTSRHHARVRITFR